MTYQRKNSQCNSYASDWLLWVYIFPIHSKRLVRACRVTTHAKLRFLLSCSCCGSRIHTWLGWAPLALGPPQGGSEVVGQSHSQSSWPELSWKKTHIHDHSGGIGGFQVLTGC